MNRLTIILFSTIILLSCSKKAAVIQFDYTSKCNQIATAHLDTQPIDALCKEVMDYRATLRDDLQAQFDAEFVNALAEKIRNESILQFLSRIEQIGDISAILVSGMIEAQLSIAETLPEHYRKPYITVCSNHMHLYNSAYSVDDYGFNLPAIADSIWLITEDVMDVDSVVGMQLGQILDPIAQYRDKLNYSERIAFNSKIFPYLSQLLWERMRVKEEFQSKDDYGAWAARRIRTLMTNCMFSSTGSTFASYILLPIGKDYIDYLQKEEEKYQQEKERKKESVQQYVIYIEVDSLTQISLGRRSDELQPVTMDELDAYFTQEFDPRTVVSLKAHKSTSMSVITNIKQTIRKHNILKVAYSTLQ